MPAPDLSDDPAQIQPKWIRETRRNRGLTQLDLAEFMGVSQSRISAWENGYDEIPLRQRQRLIDLLSNRNGRLDPFLKHLIRTDPALVINDQKTHKYRYVAPKLVTNFFHPDDEYLKWVPTDGPKPTGLLEFQFPIIAASAGRPISESILEFRTERDVPRLHKPPLRMRAHQVAVAFDDCEPLIITRYEVVRTARREKPELLSQVFLEDIDCR